MKKVALIIGINFVLVSNLFAYTVITDPNVFYAFFEKPAQVLDFSELKDGTSYNHIRGRTEADVSRAADPVCGNLAAGDVNSPTVRANAFSDAWSFSGADPARAHSFCNDLLWFDQGISTGQYNLAVTTNVGRSQPFAMYTNKGFMGIIPDTPQETLFVFENLHFIFEFEADFSKTNPVSESGASVLA